MSTNTSIVITEYDLEGQAYDEYSIAADSHDEIYKKLMELTDDDMKLSVELVNWCKKAKVGEEYKNNFFKLEKAQMMLL